MANWLTKKRHLDDPEVLNTISGGLAGALTATFVCPLDVLKTRLQVQRRQPSGQGYLSIGGGLSAIFKQEGVKGLYRGLTPTLVALLPNWAVYFTVYEKLKGTLKTRAASLPWRVSDPLLHMAAASGAGMATLAFTNPLWVVKTRLQTQHLGLKMGRNVAGPLYKGTWDALTRIGREEGILGLYSGLLPSLFGVAHVAIQFPLYEASKHWFRQRAVAEGNPDRQLTASELVIASVFSKMVASTATYPHEVIRSHMHVTGSGPFGGFGSVCKQIIAHDGLPGFYRGCVTNLLRTTPAAALTFTSFELISRNLKTFAEDSRSQQAAQQMNIMKPSTDGAP